MNNNIKKSQETFKISENGYTLSITRDLETNEVVVSDGQPFSLNLNGRLDQVENMLMTGIKLVDKVKQVIMEGK